MGKNLVFVPECPSTNSLALQISQQSPVQEGTVVITDAQTAGKGQRGNTWEATPELNLTFSAIVKPTFLAVNKQFYLNIAVSLGLKDYLREKISDVVYIKWPNDILVHEKKISGILIENQLQGSTIINSIIGIGFNLNQKQFQSLSATSLSLVSGLDYDRAAELELILECLERRYLELRRGDYGRLLSNYLDSLYRRDQRHTFMADGQKFQGAIRGISDWGKLQIESKEGLREFGVKEVAYVD